MEKSRNSKRSGGSDDRERDHHKHRHHHRSSREDHRDRERSVDPKDDGRDERSRHRERDREGSMERKPKRKERDRERDEDEEPRVPDGERKHRRRFEDANGDREERRERRRFGDKAEEADSERAEVVVAVNGAALASSAAVASTETNITSSLSVPTKVSSISTTNENKGVNVTGSHEVPGKPSTDGSSTAVGKSGSLSLDVLAKAKKALQIQKELSEKLKRIPLLKKGTGSSSDGAAQLVQKEEATVPSSSSAHLVASSAPSAPSTLPAGATPSLLPPSAGIITPAGMSTLPNYEAVKRAQELAAKMGFRQDPEFGPLINLFPGQASTEIAMPQKPTKAPVLRLDALGREIDEQGNVVNISKPSNLSTLKVNINKQKKDAFQILKPELDVDPESNRHFDEGMGINKTKLLRPKRMGFQFVEEGKWSRDAEIIKLKSQFGEARAKEQRAKQAQLAKAKSASDINPNLIEVSERVITKEKLKDEIPEVEWWDATLLHAGTYGEVDNGAIDIGKLKAEKITIYIEHPRPIEPPAEAPPPPPQPLKLTKKERKKLRTQRRMAEEKDKQEMIRQGVLPPPKPKVKMSNLMKVLGDEATQDPTRLEKEIRIAAAEREQAHVDRNIARKLTPAERRQKKERKLFDDPSTIETTVLVYKVNDLSHKQTRFKVDVNAKENRLSGCAVLSDGMCVVVVEGGMKSIKRYRKLMERRIDWAAAVGNDDEDEEEEDEKPVNKCVLVWQGIVARPSFHKFTIHECMTEAGARKVFADAGVGHYWDFAVNFAEE